MGKGRKTGVFRGGRQAACGRWKTVGFQSVLVGVGSQKALISGEVRLCHMWQSRTSPNSLKISRVKVGEFYL